MDKLRNQFPDLPDYILISYLAASDRNVDRAKQNIQNAISNSTKNPLNLDICGLDGLVDSFNEIIFGF